MIGRGAPASCIAHVERIPGRPAEYAEPSRPLPGPLADWLARDGIRLYSHQARALDAVREGRDIVLTTPTASGKTLAFTLPVLEALALDGAATALYLYPTKALANDQLRVLQATEAATGLFHRPRRVRRRYAGVAPSRDPAAVPDHPLESVRAPPGAALAREMAPVPRGPPGRGRGRGAPLPGSSARTSRSSSAGSSGSAATTAATRSSSSRPRPSQTRTILLRP